MEYVLGIDIGTSGCKCILLDGSGNPVTSQAKEYNPTILADGTVEQDPTEWYEAALACLKDFTKEGGIDLAKVIAVSVTGQMQGITLIDAKGEPVRKSILWNDTKCEKETYILNSKFEKDFVAAFGFPTTTALSVSKIHWLKQHEPDNWKKTSKFTFASNFITFKLTGNITADENNITLSGLNDSRKNTWSESLIKACEVETSKVPELTGCFDVVGKVSAQAAKESGLREGIPVVAGGGDAGAESYSIGIAGHSQMKIRLGTAADLNIVVHLDTVKDQSVLPGIRDVMRDYILIGKYTKACASSVKWVRDVFFTEMPSEGSTYGHMDEEAAKIPLGSEGLLFHPYLSGESAPYANSALRAKFHGISIGHKRGHFLRAVYEGVSFSIRDVISKVPDFQSVDELIFVGGGTKSSLWMSILTDVLGKGGVIPELCEAAYGAALIAGQGAGIFDSRVKIAEGIKKSTRVDYSRDHHEKYSEIFDRYMEYAGKN